MKMIILYYMKKMLKKLSVFYYYSTTYGLVDVPLPPDKIVPGFNDIEGLRPYELATK